MENFYGRAVFFVKNAEHALTHYTQTLGFTLDWNYQELGRAFVVQVSLFGFQLILNQTEEWTVARPGHGRVFIGLDETQATALLEHLKEKRIETSIFS